MPSLAAGSWQAPPPARYNSVRPVQYLLLPFFAVLLSAPAAGAVDAREIVRKSVAAWEGDNARLLEFLYKERVRTKELDDAGKVKSVKGKTHEIRMLEGSPYRRLLEQDGKPIPPDEQRLQEEYLKDNIERRKHEPPDERARRLEEYHKRRDRFRAAIREIPDAFTFRLAGEEMIGGRTTWVIDASPRPGYEPNDRYSKLYPDLTGRLWIDQRDSQLVRLRAELTDVVSFGWILIRIGKGAKVEMDQVRLDGGVWAPSRLWYRVAARLGLLRVYRLEEEIFYFDYKKTS